MSQCYVLRNQALQESESETWTGLWNFQSISVLYLIPQHSQTGATGEVPAKEGRLPGERSPDLHWRMAGLTGRGSRRQKYSTVYKRVRDSRAGSLFWSRRWSSPFWLGLTLVRESHHSWESALGNTKVSDLCGEFITESSWSSDLWSWFQFIKYLSKISKWDYVRSENGDRYHLLQTWNVLTQHRKRPSKWVGMDQLICFWSSSE